MELKMAPCGIDCNRCGLYRAAFDADQAAALVPWFKSEGWIKAEEGLAQVMAKAPFCTGCRGDRRVQWSGDCGIRACCADEKGLEHCGQCAHFICESLNGWSLLGKHHASAIEKLKSIRSQE